MPETPEVTYLSHYIVQHCQGKKLVSIKILRGRYLKHGAPTNYNAFVKDLPMRLIDVQKKAKVIVLCFEKNWYIVSKLGMMGWWYTSGDTPDWMGGRPNIEFKFSGLSLFYHDVLSYGTLTFTQDQQYIDNQFNRLAPEIEKVTLPALLKRIADKKTLSKKIIENVLLDQTALISGIGNYLKSEILYEARISPKRRVDSLTKEEWQVFLKSARKVIKRQLSAMGDTEAYIDTMHVYGKTADPLGNRVKKHKTKDNRTTFWVPDLQK